MLKNKYGYHITFISWFNIMVDFIMELPLDQLNTVNYIMELRKYIYIWCDILQYI